MIVTYVDCQNDCFVQWVRYVDTSVGTLEHIKIVICITTKSIVYYSHCLYNAQRFLIHVYVHKCDLIC